MPMSAALILARVARRQQLQLESGTESQGSAAKNGKAHIIRATMTTIEGCALSSVRSAD